MSVAFQRSLQELATTVRGARLAGDAVVTDITHDSRAVVAGSLFCCVPGASVDGHIFAPAVVAAGATGLLVERELDVAAGQIVVPSVRAAMGPVASACFGHPSGALELVGITGTNGKTTTTYLLEQVTRARNGIPGTIGTVEVALGEIREVATLTTPEAPEVQRLLARMVAAGVTTCAMEVSSRALDVGRVDGCSFAAAVFTNLTQDHLDEHGTMEEYFEAKSLLFDAARAQVAIVNVDDPWGRVLVERIRAAGDLPLITFALTQDADVVATAIEIRADGSFVRLSVRGEERTLLVPISGRYNVSNALGVVAVGEALGWPYAEVADGIARLAGVPGRLERIDAGQPFTVLVDYAHTPDSLENVLRATRELVAPHGQLWVVFGCGGDRDRTKRPLMGRVGATLADRCIITSDNPRSEVPEAIVAEIAAGSTDGDATVDTIVDRRDAIAAALHGANPGDVVVIAGKGHETGQKFADRTIPFDDRLVAREILEARP